MSEVPLYTRALLGYGDGTLRLFASLSHSPYPLSHSLPTLSLTHSLPSLTHSPYTRALLGYGDGTLRLSASLTHSPCRETSLIRNCAPL